MTLNYSGKTSNRQQVTAYILTCLINAVISISHGVVIGLGNVALEEFALTLQNTYVYLYLSVLLFRCHMSTLFVLSRSVYAGC